MQPNLNGAFNVSSPYFSILVIVVLLIFTWSVWGSNDRLIIEGFPEVSPDTVPTFSLKPNVASTLSATLAINTSLKIKRDGVLTLTLPPEMEVPTTNPTITPSDFGKVASIYNVCDLKDLDIEKLLTLMDSPTKKCNQETVINIIMNPASLTALTAEDLNAERPIKFELAGFKLPAYSNALKFHLTSSADALGKSQTVNITGTTGPPPAGGADGDVTECKFGITLSDDAPGAKLVTANYTFSFINGNVAATTFTIKKDKSTMYFIFSDDFQLPPIANIRVIVNKTTVLNSEKGEYTLVYKTHCSNELVSDQLSEMIGVPNKFDSKNKLCAKYYVLTLNKDIRVDSGQLMLSLSGLTNPPYYSPPAAEGKRDYLVKPFNSSLCVLNLDTTLVAGKYLMVPSPITGANAGVYFRGNYPIKNTGASSNNDGDGDDAVSNGGSSGKSRVSSSSSRATRAANVYTVNYFYDGQGAGEYGHIAQPQIFGRDPYTYNKHRTGVMGSASDASIAKHYKDYAKYNQRQSVGQIAPLMGVAPSTLNEGVQPYNSEIHF